MLQNFPEGDTEKSYDKTIKNLKTFLNVCFESLLAHFVCTRKREWQT